MRRLLELITGKNNLNYVHSKINPGIVIKLYRFCEEKEEAFAHLLNECFNTFRRDILNDIPIVNSNKWKTKTLLEFSYIPSTNEALAVDS